MAQPRITFVNGWTAMMQDFTTGTYRSLLLDNTWTPNANSDVFVADISAHEVSGAGYARQTLTGKSRGIVLPPTATGIGYVTFDCDDVDFGTPTGGDVAVYWAFYKFITNDAASPLVAAFAVNLTFDGDPIIIGISPNGLMRDATACPNDFGD